MKQILGILSVIVVIGAVIFVFSGKDHTNDSVPKASTETSATSTTEPDASVQTEQK